MVMIFLIFRILSSKLLHISHIYIYIFCTTSNCSSIININLYLFWSVHRSVDSSPKESLSESGVILKCRQGPNMKR